MSHHLIALSNNEGSGESVQMPSLLVYTQLGCRWRIRPVPLKASAWTFKRGICACEIGSWPNALFSENTTDNKSQNEVWDHCNRGTSFGSCKKKTTDINCYDLGIIRFKGNIFSYNENYQASMIAWYHKLTTDYSWVRETRNRTGPQPSRHTLLTQHRFNVDSTPWHVESTLHQCWVNNVCLLGRL